MTPDPASTGRSETYQADAPKEERTPPEERVSSPEDAIKAVKFRLEELLDSFLYLVSARLDQIKLAAFRAVIIGVAVCALGLIVLTIVLTATVILCVGIADAMSALIGSRWGGDMAAGAILLALIGAAAFIAIAPLGGIARKKTIERYNRWRERQRARFGRDVTGQTGPREKP